LEGLPCSGFVAKTSTETNTGIVDAIAERNARPKQILLGSAQLLAADVTGLKPLKNPSRFTGFPKAQFIAFGLPCIKDAKTLKARGGAITGVEE
tara:strand:- start:818 stop:1099 length:282 start_codon:yes stop_codon:yes gene_type:complete